MTQNQSEEQCLIKYFKYFDMDNSVFLPKVQDMQLVFDFYDNERKGRIDYKKLALEIFDPNAKQKRTFAPGNDKENENMLDRNLVNKLSGRKNFKSPYIEKLHDFLKPMGASGLLKLHKSFKIVDYHSSSRVNIDDFVRVISEFKIMLSITDVQMLFHSYELYKNGLFFYEEMFRDLKKIYHNEKRFEFLEAMYNNITDICKIQIRLFDLKNLFDPTHHKNVLSHEISEEEAKDEFDEMVDSFEFIMRLNRKESYLPLETFVEFFKYFGFGIDDDNDFISDAKKLFNIKMLLHSESEGRSVISKKSKGNENLEIKLNANYTSNNNQNQDSKSIRREFNTESTYKIINNNLNTRENKTTEQQNQLTTNNQNNNLNPSTKHENPRNIGRNKINSISLNNNNNITFNFNSERHETERSEKNQANNNNQNNNKANSEEFGVLSIVEKLKANLKNFGRKSLLSLIKHFKCYDNGTKFLTKPDFLKVIRDFRLNLTASEIEKLFDFYLTDKKKMLINFEEFINVICLPLNEIRKDLLLETFTEITSIGSDPKNLDLELLKSVYNPKANFFRADAEQVYTEFVECIELYHFNYKKKRNNFISLDEFLEFYRYIGFLVDSDEQFVKLIEDEFDKVKDIKAKIDLENSQQRERQRKLAEEREHYKSNYINKPNTREENVHRRDSHLTAYAEGSINNENQSFYSNESKIRNKQKSQENAVSGDILRHKLENLNNKNNYANNDHDNVSVSNASKFERKGNLENKDNRDNHSIVPDNRSEIERAPSNFKRSNKFTNEMREKALRSDENLVNYVVNKNFKNNIDKLEAPILNGNVNTNNVENNDFESHKSNNLRSGSRTPIANAHQDKNINTEVQSVYKSSHQKLNLKTETEQKDGFLNLAEKLRKRGLHGLMSLHKQFLLSCQNLNSISFNDFSKVLKLQRLDFSKEDLDALFKKFKAVNKENPLEPAFLNFVGFIRSFKSVLNEKRLQAVETAFAVLDEDKTEMLFLDDIKSKFNAKKHPEAFRKSRNEEEILLEFIDCFDLNYAYLSKDQENNDASNFISFQEFANFYEYVSFLYERDDEFINMVESVWNLN